MIVRHYFCNIHIFCGKHCRKKVNEINNSGLITRTRSIVFAGLAMVYLLNTALHNNYLNYTLSGISLLCLLVCLPYAKGNARILTLILLIAGALDRKSVV